MGSPKYIINNGRLILGIVESHEELASDHSKTVGGGWWHVDQDKNILYLYSASTRFGIPTKEEAEAAWAYSPYNKDGRRMSFSFEAQLDDAIKSSGL